MIMDLFTAHKREKRDEPRENVCVESAPKIRNKKGFRVHLCNSCFSRDVIIYV